MVETVQREKKKFQGGDDKTELEELDKDLQAAKDVSSPGFSVLSLPEFVRRLLACRLPS